LFLTFPWIKVIAILSKILSDVRMSSHLGES
jgi:hypothetical protein